MKIDEAIRRLQAEKEAGATDVIIACWPMNAFAIEEIPGRVAWSDICDSVMNDHEEWFAINENMAEMVKYAFWHLADESRKKITTAAEL